MDGIIQLKTGRLKIKVDGKLETCYHFKGEKDMKSFVFLAVFLCGAAIFSHAQNAKINMKEVRQLAKLPVKETLEGAPVTHVSVEKYHEVLKADRETEKPVISFFYSNVDPESQRLASLLKYVAHDYKESILFICVETADKGKPDKMTAVQLEKLYGVDKTPGILFYDTAEGGVVLEDEDYIHSDFKDFQTPAMMFWRTYYKVVSKKLDEILAD